MSNWGMIIKDECNGCGQCEEVCLYGAISINQKTKKAVINNVFCNACDECIDACPEKAIAKAE
ncbi:MAG: 4Fe-4S binding protein [Eubacterium sp.]|nr:4Fe-4S binding protein [Eubacterium sp.]MBR3276272.1 4Fe-4S binding protein [Eubacterium sp.]